MTFRSPLRNDWERVEPQFIAAAKGGGREATISRMMLDIMPKFVEAYERERDAKTSPHHFFDAVGAICGALIEEAIEQHAQYNILPPQQSLDRILTIISATVRPRVAAGKPSRIIRPEF